MKPADKVFLDGLRKSVCDHIPQEHWDLVVKAVNEAGDIRDVTGYARTIILEGVEKGRFASRSEAGRYAANMRWRGSVPKGGLATAEARQEANAKAGRGAGNPARGGSAAKRKEAFEDLYELTRADVKGGVTEAKDALRALANAKKAGIDSTEGKNYLRGAKNLLSEAGLDAHAEVVDEVLGTEKTPTKSTGASSGEAETKQAFIDAQKERLGNMGRGTSQGSYMALESGIKKLEAELAAGDTSEARNRPGQFFDDRGGSKGEKYIGRRPNKEVAVDIRRDLKDAVANGELPAGLKFSVKMGTGSSSAINVRVSGIKATRDPDRGGLTGEAKAVYEKVDRITNAYNRDNSDPMTDYFDTDYYGFVQIDG
jgi:Arc/MetJ-type ribon-helix-helix transcriptional regulator